jgi:hypothetical protein
MFSHPHNTLPFFPGTFLAPLTTATGTLDLQMHGAMD